MQEWLKKQFEYVEATINGCPQWMKDLTTLKKAKVMDRIPKDKPPSEEVVKKVLEKFGEFLETTPVGRDVKNIISIAPNNPESIDYIINNWSK